MRVNLLINRLQRLDLRVDPLLNERDIRLVSGTRLGACVQRRDQANREGKMHDISHDLASFLAQYKNINLQTNTYSISPPRRRRKRPGWRATA